MADSNVLETRLKKTTFVDTKNNDAGSNVWGGGRRNRRTMFPLQLYAEKFNEYVWRFRR